MKTDIHMYRLLIVMLLGWLMVVPAVASQPLFDSHLHYNAEDARHYSPSDIVSILRANDIIGAVITSRPPRQVLGLYELAPELIAPILGVYQTAADKQNWTNDTTLPLRVEQALAQGPWRGVGELHIFAEQRRNPVFLRIVELATTHSLPLQMHCDPAVIDALFEHVPKATVIWAHAGAYPYPPLLRSYLARYPNLHIDLSMRDQRIAPGGQIDPEWELLLLEYSDRFMIGADTYHTERWSNFAQLSERIRNWLEQLPNDVSEAIAYRNATQLFRHHTGQ